MPASRPPKGGSRASPAMCMLLGGLLTVLGVLGLMVHHTYRQAASHHSVIHMFDSRHEGSLVRRPEATSIVSHTRDSDGIGNPRRAGGSLESREDEENPSPAGGDHGNGGAGDDEARANVDGQRVSDGNTVAVAPEQEQEQEQEQGTCAGRPSLRHTEYWGDVVRAADKMGAVGTSAECCARCAATLGCNVWVHCAAAEGGDPGCDGQCWLKRTDDPTRPTVHAQGPGVAWTSGALLKDYDRHPGHVATGHSTDGAAEAEARARSPRKVALMTPHGRIVIHLRPDWHLDSVNYVNRLATERACKGSCHLYRAEPTFLLQGTLRSFSVAANTKTLRGPKIMERGEIGWAGGGAGPDFFIYLGDRPAAHWGHDHTVWGTVDEASLEVAERIVNLPSHTPDGPNTMRFLREFMYFDIEPET